MAESTENISISLASWNIPTTIFTESHVFLIKLIFAHKII